MRVTPMTSVIFMQISTNCAIISQMGVNQSICKQIKTVPSGEVSPVYPQCVPGSERKPAVSQVKYFFIISLILTDMYVEHD